MLAAHLKELERSIEKVFFFKIRPSLVLPFLGFIESGETSQT